MKTDHKYPGFLWASIGLLLVMILIPFADTYINRASQYENWSGDFYIAIPFIVVILVTWLSPLVGGILAIVTGIIWFIVGTSISFGMGNSQIDLEVIIYNILSVISGILSIMFYISNRHSKHK